MNEPMQNLLKLQTLEFSETGDETTAATITALRARIPPQILGHYDRFHVRDKKGLAAVVNQVCTGCHMRLPLAVVMTLKHGQDIQLCDSCGRYLYLPDEVESAPATAPRDAKPVHTAPRRKKTVAPLEPAALGGGLTPPAPARPRINPG
jgi:hypothetical protein